MKPLSKIKAPRLSWVHHPILVAGYVTAISGRTNTGKEALAKWLVKQHAESNNVAVYCDQEVLPHIFRQSLEAYGLRAIDRVYLMDEPLNVVTDFHKFVDKIREAKATLVVFRNLHRWMRVSTQKELSTAMSAFSAMAKELKASVLVIVPESRGAPGMVMLGGAKIVIETNDPSEDEYTADVVKSSFYPCGDYEHQMAFWGDETEFHVHKAFGKGD